MLVTLAAWGQAPSALDHARSLLNSPNWQQAAPIVKTYLEDHPDAAEAHLLMGLILYRQNQPRPSMAEYLKASQSTDLSAFDLRIFALDCAAIPDLPEAEKWLRRSIEMDGQDAATWEALGHVQFSSQQYEPAIESLEHALQLAPKTPSAESMIALANERLARLDAAEASYRTAIRWQTGHPDAVPFIGLGRVLLAENKPQEAIPWLQQADRMTPHSAEVHDLLDLADAKTGRERACDPALGIAFQQDPGGIDFEHHANHTAMRYPLEVMGSGVALFDFDNDGRLDVFLVNGASFPDPNPTAQPPRKAGPRDWNRLYRQKADGTFADVTAAAGLAGEDYGMGAAVGDYDNDGYDDLFVAAFPQSHLYHNNGNGTFTETTAQAGIDAQGWATSAAWVDLDQDGLLDLVVLRYLQWNFDEKFCPTPDGRQSYCDPKVFPPITPLVFHNDGHGHFTEAAQKMGFSKPGKGLGLAIADYDRDGKIDVLVANDGIEQHLYRNQGHGLFAETGLRANIAGDDYGRSFAGMGVVFQDLNNDGLSDIVIDDLALQSFAFFRNRGDGAFDYASAATGITRATMAHSGWGMQAIDTANNGWKDLIVARGHVNLDISKDNPQLSYLEPPALLRNTRHGFADVSACLGAISALPFAGRGLATGDLDNDGRIDVVMTSNDGAAYVLKNQSSSPHHWITIQLVGRASNRDGIGAEVRIAAAAGWQTATVTTAGSYQSSSDKRVHFGLADEDTVRTLEIRWPSGVQQTLHALRADRFYTVTEGLGITGVRCPGNQPLKETSSCSH